MTSFESSYEKFAVNKKTKEKLFRWKKLITYDIESYFRPKQLIFYKPNTAYEKAIRFASYRIPFWHYC